MPNDNIKITGHVKSTLIGPDGKIKAEYEGDNLVVTVGKTALAQWLTSPQSGGFMPYMGLGTSSTAPASGDTTLGAEFSGGGYSRPFATSLTSSSNVFTNTSTFAPGVGTGAIAEAGLFSTVTVGTMFAHILLGPYTKAAGDTLVVAWSITFN